MYDKCCLVKCHFYTRSSSNADYTSNSNLALSKSVKIKPRHVIQFTCKTKTAILVTLRKGETRDNNHSSGHSLV